ncbi:MAG TPA: BadF/BadG/BcrA/BcrD ATPase family protein [Ktedonobacterales bacterium]|nr:BadF/BadG/BcrA/BcrD ATPase family protein [Ktedonobacterales bacterium]
MSDPLFLGVDGGGSKTLAIVVDAQGQERGRGLAGSGNYQAVGAARALRAVRDAVTVALTMAHGHRPCRAAWLGLAGVDRARDVALLLPRVRTLARTVRLTNDAELALGALPEQVGVALIAGTGSIALGRDARGRTARAGGWGHILGDEGSGYTMGRQALTAAVRAADGRAPATALLALILAHWQLRAASELIEQVYAHEDKARIAALAPLVLQAARAGDPAAARIVRRAARELALAAGTASASLDLDATSCPLALGGGLLLHASGFRRAVLRRVRRAQAPGEYALVDHPALSAARAATTIGAADDWRRTPEAGAAPTDRCEGGPT